MSEWEIEKDILYPGRVIVPGPDGTPFAHVFTDSELQSICRSGNDKIKDNWSVPVVWEHQPVGPEKRRVKLSQAERDRDYARGVFGFSKGFIIRDGRLRAILSGHDPKDLEQFKKVRFVSPEIQWDWRDTDGKVWHGPTITHIAATPRPVQRHQSALQLSLNAHDLRAFQQFPDFLTAVQNPARVAGTIHPLSIRLSLTDWEKPMADDLDQAPSGSADDSGKKKGNPYERIAAALLCCGIKIGDGKGINDASHLADLIEVAAMNSPAAEPEEDDLEPDEEGDGDGTGDQQPGTDLDQAPPGSTAQPAPLQMSLDAYGNKLIANARERLVSRAKRIASSGALSPVDGDELVSKMQTVRLSLNTKTGDVERNDAIIELEALERVKPGTTVRLRGKKQRVRMSHTRPADDTPYRRTDASDSKDDDDVVAAFEDAVGRGGAKK